MDYEQLFVESKWGILKLLSEDDYSPMELAEKMNTSISNISQQLRFLEMAGLVTKERVSNRDKGKPRAKFSIASDYLYGVVITKEFARKKLMPLAPRQKMMVQIWQLSEEQQYLAEKFFWKIEEKVVGMKAMALDNAGKGLRFIIIAEKGDGNRSTMKLHKDGKESEVEYTVISQEDYLKKASTFKGLDVLYDPENVLNKRRTKGVLNHAPSR